MLRATRPASRRALLTGLALGGLSALATACGVGGAPVAPVGPAAPAAAVGQSPRAVITDLRSSRPRQPLATDAAADVTDHARAVNAFALDLYRALAPAGNLFFSPFSIAQALMLVLAGARGETADEIARALHLGPPLERAHQAAGALDLLLKRRAEGDGGGQASGSLRAAFQLDIANVLWGQTGHPFQAPFLDLLVEHYDAGLRLLDFRAAHEPARAAINAAVADQTRGKIVDVLPPDSVSALTRLVLTNAIYFKADWRLAFAPGMTKDGPFTLPTGDRVTMPMMSRPEARSAFAEGADYQAIELPYQGETSMVLLVPAAGRFAQVERGLTGATLDSILAAMQPREVNLVMPRFRQTEDLTLRAPLSKLGIAAAFQASAADLSGMDGTRDLVLDQGYHQATVTVDESGTEAAAATAMTAVHLSLQIASPVSLVVDRPFLYLIRDDRSGVVLFLGRVLDPRERGLRTAD